MTVSKTEIQTTPEGAEQHIPKELKDVLPYLDEEKINQLDTLNLDYALMSEQTKDLTADPSQAEEIKHNWLQEKINDMLIDFMPENMTFDDPEFEAHVASAYNALQLVAEMPINQWDEMDDEGEPLGKGVKHELLQAIRTPDEGEEEIVIEPDKVKKFEPRVYASIHAILNPADEEHKVANPIRPEDIKYVIPEQPRRPGQAQEVRQGNVPNSSARYVGPEELRSVEKKRYGAEVGDKLAFTQRNPDGSMVFIQYVVLAFPEQRPGEAHPPVTLGRTETLYDPQGRQVRITHSNYTLSSDHLVHLGKDIAAYKKQEKGNDSRDLADHGVDLKEYWDKMIPEREKKPVRREQMRRVAGRVALFSLGVATGVAVALEATGKTHGLSATLNTMRDVLGNLHPGPELAMPTPDLAHHLSPDALQTLVGSHAANGGDLLNSVGADPSQWAHIGSGLVDHFPAEFVVDQSGNVVRSNPQESMTPEAIAYIAQHAGLWS